jgi:hypothetical protein
MGMGTTLRDLLQARDEQRQMYVPVLANKFFAINQILVNKGGEEEAAKDLGKIISAINEQQHGMVNLYVHSLEGKSCAMENTPCEVRVNTQDHYINIVPLGYHLTPALRYDCDINIFSCLLKTEFEFPATSKARPYAIRLFHEGRMRMPDS